MSKYQSQGNQYQETPPSIYLIYIEIPYPGDLKNIIKTAVAFSDLQDDADYLRRLYYMVCGEKAADLKILQEQKFTVREIEILAQKPKSTVARELKDEVTNE